MLLYLYKGNWDILEEQVINLIVFNKLKNILKFSLINGYILYKDTRLVKGGFVMKILVAIDGSEYSKRAMIKAKEFGSALKADIKLLHVINPEINIRSMQNRDFYDEVNKNVVLNSREILDKGLELFNDYEGEIKAINVTGDAVGQIIKIAENEQFDLVMMGSRGAGVFSRTLLGSVSNKVIHHIKTSILIVK